MSESLLRTYAYLARIYDDFGFSNYAAELTPEIITFMQKQDWAGRRILDLGCGTGRSTVFFAERNFEVTGYDLSPDMLQVARIRNEGTGYHAEFVQGDVRTVPFPPEVDLIFAIGGLINELNSLQELGGLAQKAFNSLAPKRRFVFDMWTLNGLGKQLGDRDQIIDFSDRVFLTVKSNFQYEALALRQELVFFIRENESDWRRYNLFLTLKSYPQSAVQAVLTKVGFNVVGVYDTQFTPYQEASDPFGRALIIAEKP
jgi:SAM-dependent methyltransferase